MIAETDPSAYAVLAQLSPGCEQEARRIYDDCRKKGMVPRDAMRWVMSEIVRVGEECGTNDDNGKSQLI